MLVPALSRFLHWFVVGLASPILNLALLSRGLGMDGLGLAWMCYSIAIVVLELPTGILADLIGRKRVYLAALAVSALAYAALIPARGFPAVAGAVILMALARALSSGSIEALFIDRHIEARGAERLHELSAVLGIAEPAGLALGALLGGLLPMLWSRLSPGADRYSGNLFLMLAVVAAHVILIGLAVKPDRIGKPAESPRLGAFLKDSISFIKSSPVFALILLGTFAWGLSFQPIEMFWQPRLESLLGGSEKTWIFGLLSSGYFLAGMIGAGLFGILWKRGGSTLRLVAGLKVLNGFFIGILALQTGIGGFAVFYLGMFVFNGLANPPESTALNLEIPAARRASLLSLVSLFLQAGGGLGSLLFGQVARRASIPAAWLGAGLALAASALFYVAAARILKRRSEPPLQA